MVVEVGCTVVEPMRVEVANEPGVMATEDAFVMFQERVDVPAEATTEEDAEKEEIMGCGADEVNARAEEPYDSPRISRERRLICSGCYVKGIVSGAIHVSKRRSRQEYVIGVVHPLPEIVCVP